MFGMDLDQRRVDVQHDPLARIDPRPHIDRGCARDNGLRALRGAGVEIRPRLAEEIRSE